MTKFLDKKERVIDFQLTPHGRRKLAAGKLKPVYYAFYDDGVIYDSNFVGFDEAQNAIHSRIKNDTSYIEGVLSFEEIENATPPGNYLEPASEDVTSMSAADFDISPDKNILQTNKFTFDSAIGDAAFEGENTQAAPAWKVVTCQGEILSTSVRDTSTYDFTHVELDEEAREFNIPQLEVELYYTKLIDKPSSPFDYTSVSDSVSETPVFADGYSIRLVKDDLVVYAEEANTQILTENFDIEVFHMEQDVIGEQTLAQATIAFQAELENSSSAPIISLLNKTITINDGTNERTFEFIRDKGARTRPQNVGVIISENFMVEGDAATKVQVDGTMYNLIAAIDDSFNNKYPTSEYYLGSDSDGSPVRGFTIAGDPPVEVVRGKCSEDSRQVKCFIPASDAEPDADVGAFPNVQVGSGGIHVPPPVFGERNSDGEASFIVTNLNMGKLGSITTTVDEAHIKITDFSGAASHRITTLERKFFEKEIPHIVDGIMTSISPKKNLNTELNTDAVEYYFDVLTDTSVNGKIACECASAFNKNSYYIDLDFDPEFCKDTEVTEMYFDIYGSVTVPEICDSDIIEPFGGEPCEDNE